MLHEFPCTDLYTDASYLLKTNPMQALSETATALLNITTEVALHWITPVLSLSAPSSGWRLQRGPLPALLVLLAWPTVILMVGMGSGSVWSDFRVVI